MLPYLWGLKHSFQVTVFHPACAILCLLITRNCHSPSRGGGSASQPVMHHQNRFSFRQLSPWAGLGKEQEQQLSQPPALHIHRHHLKVMSSPGPSGCWRKINKRYSTFVLSAVTRPAGFFSGLQQQLDLELTEKKSCSNTSSLSAFNHLAPSLTLQKVNRQTRHSG